MEYEGVDNAVFHVGVVSGSMDGSVKIWDVYNERHVKRTYNGHSQAVRCINFNNDGSK